MIDLKVLNRLNQGSHEVRLEQLAGQAEAISLPMRNPRYINNHIHTFYSFSPYSPTAAVYSAAAAGLCTAGIIDHDSISGATEFLKAAEILKIPVTCGIECRVSFAGTPFAERRLNNPDQVGVAYMTLHGVAAKYFDRIDQFLAPLRVKRNTRNRRMIERLNELTDDPRLTLSFEQDVLPLSRQTEGGSVTERHLLYALALRLTRVLKTGSAMIGFFERHQISLSEKEKDRLAATEQPFYAYEILNVLKAKLISAIYIPASDELCTLSEIQALAREIDAILCYAYLGDVVSSVTGDKKAQTFEDPYLDELFDYLNLKEIKAITYMPARNTAAQLTRIKDLCQKYNLFQISGEDINSPTQDFICHAMEKPEFSNLIDSTWALIAHEREAEKENGQTFFSAQMCEKYPLISDRVAYFAGLITEEEKQFNR